MSASTERKNRQTARSEGSYAKDINAQKEAAKEPGLPEKVLGSLSEWWNGLGKGGEGSTKTAPVTAPAQEEATTKAKPRVEGQAPFFGRAPQNSAGNAGQENTAAMAEAPTAAQPKVDFRGPLQGGTYGAQTGETQSEDTEGTVKTQPKVEGQAAFFGGTGFFSSFSETTGSVT